MAEQVIDPVCQTHLDPVLAPFEAVYEDVMYYFCSDRCLQAFQQGHQESEILEALQVAGADLGPALGSHGTHRQRDCQVGRRNPEKATGLQIQLLSCQSHPK